MRKCALFLLPLLLGCDLGQSSQEKTITYLQMEFRENSKLFLSFEPNFPERLRWNSQHTPREEIEIKVALTDPEIATPEFQQMVATLNPDVVWINNSGFQKSMGFVIGSSGWPAKKTEWGFAFFEESPFRENAPQQQGRMMNFHSFNYGTFGSCDEAIDVIIEGNIRYLDCELGENWFAVYWPSE